MNWVSASLIVTSLLTIFSQSIFANILSVIESGNLELFKSLFEKSDINFDSVIISTVIKCRISFIECIIESGFDITQVDSSIDLLGTATAINCTEALKIFLSKGVDPDRHAPLITAVQLKNVDAVNILLGAGANPNVKNENGTTPFLKAIERNNWKIAKILLDGGADPTIANRFNVTPLILALGNYKKHPKMVHSLLDSGLNLNINTVDKYGRCALSMACSNYDIDVVERLLQLGADPNYVDSSGNTILHNLLERELQFDYFMVGGLLYYPDDENTMTNSSYLNEGCGKRMLVVKALFMHSADYMKQNYEGKTLLDIIFENTENEIFCETGYYSLMGSQRNRKIEN